MNINDSSDMDLSHDCNEKVEEFLKQLNDELLRGTEHEEFVQTKKNAARTVKQCARKINQNIINTTRKNEYNNEYLENWIKTYTDGVNELTKNELESLDTLKQSRQEMFQAQLAEKNDFWEKEVLQRREEAVQLKNMISHLQSLISIAKNEAKTDIEEAQKSAAKKILAQKKIIQKQIQHIGDLTEQIEKENSNFELAVKQTNQANSNATHQKKDQLSRLQLVVVQLHSKLKDKENTNEVQFRQQVKIIKRMHQQLQQSREVEKKNLEELQRLKKVRSSLSRKISAQNDESATLQHQLSSCMEDNEELQADIVKLQNKMFPEIFDQRVL